jgi:hypothetical protein
MLAKQDVTIAQTPDAVLSLFQLDHLVKIANVL